MSKAVYSRLYHTLTPFLYPFTTAELQRYARFASRNLRQHQCLRYSSNSITSYSSSTFPANDYHDQDQHHSHLNPPPSDYSHTPFTDSCTVTITSGSGGNGCVSFLRDKYIANGPPNGGDGGAGGNIYIQAIRGETSLHKLKRRREIKAGRGGHGMGMSRNGIRGTDVVIEVPVGTVVREVARWDPVDVEEEEAMWEARERRMERRAEKRRLDQEKKDEAAGLVEEQEREQQEQEEEDEEDVILSRSQRKQQRLADKAQRREERHNAYLARTERASEDPLAALGPSRRDKFVMYPGADPSTLFTTSLPHLPPPRRSNLYSLLPEAPITLDLQSEMEAPRPLACGASGGLGNPHFISGDLALPKIATKGDGGIKLVLHLELKLLADVGLVGLPNAGKSTLLRSVSNSRTRVGSWAFTTLQPSIGTVVLEDYKRRSSRSSPSSSSSSAAALALARGSGRQRFTIADIPGVIEDAHLDRGLGLSFLRHIERARVLAFVLDLSAGDAVTALKALWNEVSSYQDLSARRGAAAQLERDTGLEEWTPGFLGSDGDADGLSASSVSSDARTMDAEAIAAAVARLPPIPLPPLTAKPWFVVGTKADLAGTPENFLGLKAYLEKVRDGAEPHPSGKAEARTTGVEAVPVSGIRGEGVGRIAEVVCGLLNEG